jgi:hypothetical protein
MLTTPKSSLQGVNTVSRTSFQRISILPATASAKRCRHQNLGSQRQRNIRCDAENDPASALVQVATNIKATGNIREKQQSRCAVFFFYLICFAQTN